MSEVKSLDSLICDVRIKIQSLHHELLQLARTSLKASSLIQKEAEMKSLKFQLADFEQQSLQQRKSAYTDDIWRLPFDPYVSPLFAPQPIPQPLQKTSPSLLLWASEQAVIKAKRERVINPTQQKQSEPQTQAGASFDDPIQASSRQQNILTIETKDLVTSLLKSLTKTVSNNPSQEIHQASTSRWEKEFDSMEEAFDHLFMAGTERNDSDQGSIIHEDEAGLLSCGLSLLPVFLRVSPCA